MWSKRSTIKPINKRITDMDWLRIIDMYTIDILCCGKIVGYLRMGETSVSGPGVYAAPGCTLYSTLHTSEYLLQAVYPYRDRPDWALVYRCLALINYVSN